MQEFKDKQVKVLWNIILYTSLVFLVFFVFYGFKTMGGETCTNQAFSNTPSIDTKNIIGNSNHSFVMSTPDKYGQNIERTTICMDLKTNTSSYAEVVINGVSVYVNNLTSELSCAEEVTVNNDMLVFSCVDCDVNKALVVGLASESGVHIGNSITYQRLAYHRTILIEHCKELYKDVVQVYFALLLCYLFIFLIVRGTKWFERWVNNG